MSRFRWAWTSLKFIKISLWVWDFSLCNFRDLIYAETACNTSKRKENLKSHHMTPLKYFTRFCTSVNAWPFIRTIRTISPPVTQLSLGNAQWCSWTHNRWTSTDWRLRRYKTWACFVHWHHVYFPSVSFHCAEKIQIEHWSLNGC